ncbi:unnamed protein product [Prorocentrum cordatum]|uniref:Uncharacterized protein n=1 Tax=Prorocentrum cordatum TaxID=2364126 RepID=A0ABN9YDC3_9DINO|nr:unnamed protein product [Polarella glacialis]
MVTWAFALYLGAKLRQVWHQRLALGEEELSGGRLEVIATPDRHDYAEVNSAGSPDVAAVRGAAGFPVGPDGLPPNDVYRFRSEPTAAEVAGSTAAAVAEAAAEAAALAAAQGLAVTADAAQCLVPVAPPKLLAGVGGTAVPVAAAAIVPVAAGAPPAAIPPAQVPPPVGPRQGVGATYGGHELEDEVQRVAGPAAVGTKDLHGLADGSGLFVINLRPDEEYFFGGIVAADARTLPACRDKLGRRERSWADMRAAVTRDDFGKEWIPLGVRTAAWCLEPINAEGGSLDGHRDRFGSVCRLEPNAWGLGEHFHLAVAVKAALLVDQLDGADLVAIEMLPRRVQTIEFDHLERAKEAESKGYSGRLSQEEQQAFAGLSQGLGPPMICPKALGVVRANVEREAQLNEALRQGREEREAVRKKGDQG